MEIIEVRRELILVHQKPSGNCNLLLWRASVRPSDELDDEVRASGRDFQLMDVRTGVLYVHRDVFSLIWSRLFSG